MANIYEDITKTIGRTPLVRINKLNKNPNTVLVKLESFNPLSSVKDRIGIAMIEAAEREGKIVNKLLEDPVNRKIANREASGVYYKGDYLLGRIYYETKHIIGAVDKFESILSKKRDFPESYYYLGKIDYNTVLANADIYTEEQENNLLQVSLKKLIPQIEYI